MDDHESIERDIENGRTKSHFIAIIASPFFRVMPFSVSLKARLKLFEQLVTKERREIQGVNEEGTLRPGLQVRIQRGRVLEDGLVHMNKLGSRMKERLMVQYINEGGTVESGIDVGGLFKDFWGDLSGLAFSAGYALFVDTDHGMYPSPMSFAAHGADHVVLFEFLGRILGKALFEGITIQPVSPNARERSERKQELAAHPSTTSFCASGAGERLTPLAPKRASGSGASTTSFFCASGAGGSSGRAPNAARS